MEEKKGSEQKQEVEEGKNQEKIQWQYIFLPFVIFLIPFINFIKSNGYSLFATEVVISVFIFMVVGSLIGGVVTVNSLFTRIPLLAGCLLIFVDVQTDLFTTNTYSLKTKLLILMMFFALLCGISWVIWRYLEAMLLPFFLFVLLSTVVFPGKSKSVPKAKTAAKQTSTQSKSQKKLPILVHILLDEHIGIEGIPKSFDPKGRLAKRLKTDYAEHGFHLFGRAYSLFQATVLSVASMFQFSKHPSQVSEPPLRNSAHFLGMKENDYFTELKKRGYSLNIYQTSYLMYCRRKAAQGSKFIKSCQTYSSYPNDLSKYGFTTKQKLSILLTSYLKLSRVFSYALVFYQKAYRSFLGKFGLFPKLNTEGLMLSDSMGVMNRLPKELARAKPGNAYYIHLLSSHYPYSYDRQCKMRKPPWLTRSNAKAAPQRNTPQSRRHRYAVYLEQLECIHKKLLAVFTALKHAKIYDQSMIIIHGDHGSRISIEDPVRRGRKLSKADLVDSFSTLLAVKMPFSKKGTYRRDIISINDVFQKLISKNTLPVNQKYSTIPKVYLPYSRKVPRKMPLFSNGTVPDSPTQKR